MQPKFSLLPFLSSFIATKIRPFSCARAAHRGPGSQGKLETHAALGEGYQCPDRYPSEAKRRWTTTIEYGLPGIFQHPVTGQQLQAQISDYDLGPSL
ncbi:uncharacterized protein BT62DRAFT_374315 [Guyanagaster necrorhizus]|uniref:Uncharacterized protein n=1 Tax=Guyanagaster necrorhizus TaxID=856835 RepID=A0A9P8ANY7_9AGAR|nr:uncharacterized protein BT62DRAFT_374315 [Guyanagaster necrorhizus MCA 3950]KAG7442788.1 hypothetical protein BT62DRAFT_374315 [Guyanagaster necrorhizus MCA 3950]